jgi:hypothetical protein
MIDTVMVNIGAVFMIVGGVALVAIVLSLVIYAAGWAWVAASDKWRDILRAESLIYEYRMNRDAYIKWRRNANKTVDSSTSVVRCKNCKHSCKDGTGRTCEGYWYELSEFAVPVEDDGFCSYGERKDGGADHEVD